MGLGDWAGGGQNAEAKGGAGWGSLESKPLGGTRGRIPIWLGAKTSPCPCERRFPHLLSGAQ